MEQAVDFLLPMAAAALESEKALYQKRELEEQARNIFRHHHVTWKESDLLLDVLKNWRVGKWHRRAAKKVSSSASGYVYQYPCCREYLVRDDSFEPPQVISHGCKNKNESMAFKTAWEDTVSWTFSPRTIDELLMSLRLIQNRSYKISDGPI